VTVTLDKLRDEGDHEGLLIAPPTRFHILVDPRTRSLIRYGLEIKDRYLEQIVNRVEAGEMSIDHIHFDSD
jgi:hypothetical protein